MFRCTCRSCDVRCLRPSEAMPRYARHTTFPLRWAPSGWLAQKSAKERGKKRWVGVQGGGRSPSMSRVLVTTPFPRTRLRSCACSVTVSNRESCKNPLAENGSYKCQTMGPQRQKWFRPLEHQVFSGRLRFFRQRARVWKEARETSMKLSNKRSESLSHACMSGRCVIPVGSVKVVKVVKATESYRELAKIFRALRCRTK
ncbi:hypothetical protein B0T21DRAFT_12123 [Apiosordaria backusii]|uniref:Uncharacterized protein n=1 Tax=Apiosordaria backusii TaxID=314023 RepID=A0AA40EYQ1_9PEZI|nr:hypothetical protein B0T21DRAFT_12123 [Apiosordaria backusii]